MFKLTDVSLICQHEAECVNEAFDLSAHLYPQRSLMVMSFGY